MATAQQTQQAGTVDVSESMSGLDVLNEEMSTTAMEDVQTEAPQEIMDMLSEAYAETDNRLSGSGSDVLRAAFGGSVSWQIASAQQGSTLDSAEVLQSVKLKDGDPPPAWYDESRGNWLGWFGRRGNTTTLMSEYAWVNKSGVLTMSYADGDDITYQLIKYTPPRPYTPKEQQESRFLDKNGDATLQYGLYKFVEGASGLINLLNPADNIIQAATGRNLNVFDAEKFGNQLTWKEIGLQIIQAGVESVAAAEVAAFNGIQKSAMAVTVVSQSFGKVGVDVLVSRGLISKQNAALCSMFIEALGLANTFTKVTNIKFEGFGVTDFLDTVVTMKKAGTELIRSQGGDAAVKWFEENTNTVMPWLSSANDLLKLGEAVKGS